MIRLYYQGKRPGLFIDNIRFYILVVAFLISIMIACIMRLNFMSDTLFLIRLQQIYGFLALGLWYVALLASPLSVIFGKDRFMAQYLFARRAIGVSGAYFAVLHMMLGVFGQLGGPTNLLSLPGRFRLALVFGAIGLMVLVIMALTSFDYAVRKLTFARWKLIHRLSYPAVVLVLLHVWIIGTHLQYTPARISILLSIGILAILESWRISLKIEEASGQENKNLRLIIFTCLAMIVIGLSFYIPYSTPRYHDAKHTTTGAHQ